MNFFFCFECEIFQMISEMANDDTDIDQNKTNKVFYWEEKKIR